MQDEPHPPEILQAVAAFLRDIVVPGAAPAMAYQARVAAAALDLVRRELELGPAAEAAELAGLVALIGKVENVLEGRAALAAQLESGAMTLRSPGVAAHLRRTALAKLAIDQPHYHGVAASGEDTA